MEDDPVDPLPALLAELEQLKSMGPMFARYASTWFAAYVAVGFSEAQALYLTAVQLKGVGPPPA